MSNVFEGLHILRVALRRNGPLQLLFYLSNLDIARFIEYSKATQYSCNENMHTILDLGAGYSIFPILLKEKMREKYSEYITLDLGLNACKYQAAYKDANMLQVQGDMMHLPIRSSSIEVIIAISSIEHVLDDSLVFQEISRVLKENGVAIVSFPYSYKGSKIAKIRKVPHSLMSMIFKFHKVLSIVLGVHLNYFIEQTKTDSLTKYYSDIEIRSILNRSGLSLEKRFCFGKYGKLLSVLLRFFPGGWFVVKDLLLSAALLRIDSTLMKNDRDAKGIILKVRKQVSL